ncbi:TMV resistance protein N [Tanacetum coccineum]|uniref:TMV resistance protein N n=1 Tax=Tanacetum coccineum TaxID=301880 RepID=A0ABQ4YM29_9ASTR
MQLLDTTTLIYSMILPRGLSITPQLSAAIKDSRIFVVVFSTNYADSKWCLNELCEMMHLEQMSDQCIVLIVFLDVKKSDVGTQQERQLPDGLHLQDDGNGDEGTLVDLVVETVRKVKHGQDSNIADNLVGIGSQIEEVILMLKLGSMDVADDGMRVIAICGPEGVGIL